MLVHSRRCIQVHSIEIITISVPMMEEHNQRCLWDVCQHNVVVLLHPIHKALSEICSFDSCDEVWQLPYSC